MALALFRNNKNKKKGGELPKLLVLFSLNGIYFFVEWDILIFFPLAPEFIKYFSQTLGVSDEFCAAPKVGH